MVLKNNIFCVGVQYRERVCLNSTGCPGEPLNYRVCSIHPCPDSALSWRDEQCARLGGFSILEGHTMGFQRMESFFHTSIFKKNHTFCVFLQKFYKFSKKLPNLFIHNIYFFEFNFFIKIEN